MVYDGTPAGLRGAQDGMCDRSDSCGQYSRLHFSVVHVVSDVEEKWSWRFHCEHGHAFLNFRLTVKITVSLSAG